MVGAKIGSEVVRYSERPLNLPNPDHNRVVQWGTLTWEEKNVGWIRHRDADDADRVAAAYRAAR